MENQGPSNANDIGVISGKDQHVPGQKSNSSMCKPILEPRKVPLFLGQIKREQDQTHPDPPIQGVKGSILANLGQKSKAREEWSGVQGEGVWSRRGELSQIPSRSSEIRGEAHIKGKPSAATGSVSNQVFKYESSQSPEEKSVSESKTSGPCQDYF